MINFDKELFYPDAAVGVPRRGTKKPHLAAVKAQFKLAVYINRFLVTKFNVFNIGAATFV